MFHGDDWYDMCFMFWCILTYTRTIMSKKEIYVSLVGNKDIMKVNVNCCRCYKHLKRDIKFLEYFVPFFSMKVS